MSTKRPLLISVMQFEDGLKSGEMDVFDVIQLADDLGVDGVELRRETWPNLDDEIDHARQRIEELDLLVTYATHATLFAADGEGQSALRSDIESAYRLGASQVRFFPGQLPDPTHDAAWAVAREVVDYAGERNLIIALENYVGMPGGTLDEIEQSLGRLESRHLRTNLDIGNYWGRDQDVVAAIDALGDKIVSVHLKDRSGVSGEPPLPLGEGVMPLGSIFAALSALPQRVICCFEFRGGEDPEAAIGTSLDYLKRVKL